MNVSRTDISDLVLITLEAEVPVSSLKPFTEKLKRIIEVYAVKAYPAGEGLKKTGFYRLSVKALNTGLWNLMGKYGATLSSMSEDSLVISKTGAWIGTCRNCTICWKGRIYWVFVKAA